MSIGKRMQLLFCLAGAGVTAVFSTACAPWPHFYTKTPSISGNVTKNGVPLSGAEVMISHEYNDNVCGRAVMVATTDVDGNFKLSKTRGFRLFTTMGDHLYKNQICIETGGKKYIGYTISGIGYPPCSIKLKCDIDSGSGFVDENTPKDDMATIAVCASEGSLLGGDGRSRISGECENGVWDEEACKRTEPFYDNEILEVVR